MANLASEKFIETLLSYGPGGLLLLILILGYRTGILQKMIKPKTSKNCGNSDCRDQLITACQDSIAATNMNISMITKELTLLRKEQKGFSETLREIAGQVKYIYGFHEKERLIQKKPTGG